MLMGFKDTILDNTVVVDDLHSAEGHGQWTAQSANAAVWLSSEVVLFPPLNTRTNWRWGKLVILRLVGGP